VRKCCDEARFLAEIRDLSIAQEELMFFRRRHRGTIIEEGLKIAGSVSAEGLVEINGHIEGDVHCTSLIISQKAAITGAVEADRILVDGRVEGPLRGGEVVLKSHAHVVGDIHHQHLSIEPGAHFEGRSVCSLETSVQKAPEKLTTRVRKAMELKATREDAVALQ
jgi:cytoskeletal protein CcmA (bactofilin family)